MLLPIVTSVILVLSFVLPYVGALLIAETHKSNDESIYLTTTTKQDRFKWAAAGWTMLVIGFCLIPIPYVVMFLDGRYGWGYVMLLLFICYCAMAGEINDKFEATAKAKRKTDAEASVSS